MRTIRADTTIAAFRRQVPLGSADRVVVTDEAGRYAGVVLTPEAHGADETVTRISEILHYPKDVLLPQMTIKEAVQMFEIDRVGRARRGGRSRYPQRHRAADRAVRATPLHRGAGPPAAGPVRRVKPQGAALQPQ